MSDNWISVDDGRFVQLPCKVGETVYAVTSPINIFYDSEETEPQVFECKVGSITIYSKGELQIRLYHNGIFVAWYITGKEFGESIFFDREEAEKALKRSEE